MRTSTERRCEKVTVKKVYIQVGDDGMPVAPCGFALWEGARFLGLNPQGFRVNDIDPSGYMHPHGPSLDRPSQLIHGWVLTVHTAFRHMNVQIPEPLDYPEELDTFQFMGRNVHKTTLGEAHRDFAANEKRPMFIKPVAHKMFTGHTLERFSDLAETTYMDMSMPIWRSEIVDFVSEYRCFVHEGGLVGIQRYYGDNWILPNKNDVIQMINAYKSAPIAYALDVGITRDGFTKLVEVNDCYALGHYGLSPLKYTEMVIARWQQIVGE